MNKAGKFMISVSFILLLFGCSSSAKSALTLSASQLNTLAPETTGYSNDDAIAKFSQNRDMDRYVVTDCVLVDDAKIPLLKAVLCFYDKTNNNSCNLAFIYGDVSMIMGFAANESEDSKTFDISDDNRLFYIGDGAVTISARRIDTNEVLDFTISFSSNDSTSASDFLIVSKKHKL